MNSSHPFLCFAADHAKYRQLAIEYWSGEEIDGRWKWDTTADELSHRHGVPKKDVPKLVKLAATAVNLKHRCVGCNSPEVLSLRSAFISQFCGDHLCRECLEIQRQARLKKQEDEAKARSAAQREIISDLSRRNATFHYDNIGFVEAVIAFSIMLASDEACEQGQFGETDRLNLCASTSLTGQFLNRLFSAGILGIDEHTPPNAIEIQESRRWSYYPNRVIWRFARDEQCRSFPEIMTLLGDVIDKREKLDSDHSKSVVELWRALAYDDALEHLSSEVDTYRLPDARIGPKTDEAIWHALEYFSIPQVRREITNVVKNAAALSQRRDFVKRHALNTIPGNLIRYVDRAMSEGWQISPMLHDWQNDEPIILTVLFNRVLGTGLPGFKSLSHSVLATTSTKETTVR